MLLQGDAVAISATEVADFRAFALDAVRSAGQETLKYFRTQFSLADQSLQDKNPGGRFDPVTAADRAAEEAIRRRIRSHFPEHGILGEEHGHEPGRSPLTWVIDPIDGTRAFMTGMLHWGVLLALYDGRSPVIGVMHQPFTDEFFIGVPGAAEYRRGTQRKPLQVRSCPALTDACLATTGTDYFSPDAFARFEKVRKTVRLRRFGGDCYLYGLIALGQLDLVIEWDLKPYDIQALIPIVRGAGGVLTTWQGGDPSLGGAIVAAGDARRHAEVLSLLSEGAPL